jgi:hypothetical protein
MFGYAPQESDQSGRIIAQGMTSAAQTNAQTMGQIGQDIGGALANIGQMYGALEERKAKGRAFKKTMEVMGPSLGMTSDKLKAAFGDVKTDMDYANLSDSLMPVLPSWVNSTLASSRIEQAPELQQLRDAAATGRMYDAEQLRREREALKTPAAPNPLSVPTAMRRFNNKPTP